jgi:hypothetical protein
MDDLLIRFLIRGLVVSAFSSLGDILRPKKSYRPSALTAAIALMPFWFCRVIWLVVSGREATVKRIEVDLSALKETKPHEYAVRF